MSGSSPCHRSSPRFTIPPCCRPSVAAYAQIEPLQKEYDEKLQRFSDLYAYARERDNHRGLLDLQRWRSKHYAETWGRMLEIIRLVSQINDVTKRGISVVHAMALLAEVECVRFWNELILPLTDLE